MDRPHFVCNVKVKQKYRAESPVRELLFGNKQRTGLQSGTCVQAGMASLLGKQREGQEF
jgi:hypothetical protein